MKILDFLYVDTPKVISIYSQMTGGVVDIVERSTHQHEDADNKRSYDFRVFKHGAGSTTTTGGSEKYTLKPHHSLLTELEGILAENDQLIDLSDPIKLDLRDITLRCKAKKSLCIKVNGRAVLEDYDRLVSIGDSFPAILEFINRSISSSVAEDPMVRQLNESIGAAKENINQLKNREERSRRSSELSEMKRSLEELINSRKINGVEQWVLNGMKAWIDAYLSGIFNIRIYPDISDSSQQVFGNLKKEYLESGSSQIIHYTYGSFPTEELTLLGIITSVPDIEGEGFNPLEEFDKEGLQDDESIERAFRNIFRGFDGFEKMIRTCRYPRIQTYPLLVYRSMGGT